MNPRLDRVTEQFDEMAAECIEYGAVPLIVVAIDRHKKGHMFWPDDLPDELKAALPKLLQDVLDALAENPL